METKVKQLKEQGFSFAEIGEQLGITKSKAYRLYSNASETQQNDTTETDVSKRAKTQFQGVLQGENTHNYSPQMSADQLKAYKSLREAEMKHERDMLILKHKFENKNESEIARLKGKIETLEILINESENNEEINGYDDSEELDDEELNEYEEDDVEELDDNEEEFPLENRIYSANELFLTEKMYGKSVEVSLLNKELIFNLLTELKEKTHNSSFSENAIKQIDNILAGLEKDNPGVNFMHPFLTSLRTYLEEAKMRHSWLFHYDYEKVPFYLKEKIEEYLKN